MIIITRKFEFAYAHSLPHHTGKCIELHGHNALLEVSVRGHLQMEGEARGMVMDFSVLDAIVKKLIINKLDHTHINKLEKFSYRDNVKHYLWNDMTDNPTAENMASWIWNVLFEQFYNPMKLHKIKLYETPNNFVEIM